jgi:hypothetical protein
VLDWINQRGHGRDPAHCQILRFEEFKEQTTRRPIAKNEYEYRVVFQTNFERVFEVKVFHGISPWKEENVTVVHEARQLSIYNSFRECSQVLMSDSSDSGTVPSAVQYCACDLRSVAKHTKTLLEGKSIS